MSTLGSWDRRVVLGQQTSEPSTTRRSQEEEPKRWHSRGYIPHFDAPGLIQHITFHLEDSLPADAISRMQRALEAIPDEQREREQRRRIQGLLDNGLGSCVLRRDACAQIVEDSLFFSDGDRYRLLAWVIMPNHVHVLIEQQEGWPLSKVVQSWKRHSSRHIHLLGSPSGTRREDAGNLHATAYHSLWQRDYWDRFIRDERHFLTAKRYIEENPVMAGLVPSASEWPWGKCTI